MKIRSIFSDKETLFYEAIMSSSFYSRTAKASPLHLRKSWKLKASNIMCELATRLLQKNSLLMLGNSPKVTGAVRPLR